MRKRDALRSIVSGVLAGFVLAAAPAATVPAVAAGLCRTSTELSPTEAAQAAREGAGFAARHEPYGVAPWVLFASRDPLRAEPDRAGVDAVIMETPFERIRNESYLQQYQGESITASAIARMQRQAVGTIGFIVYAHSRSESDRGFMGAYAPAAIVVDGHRRLRANDIVRFGPSSDFYDVGTFRSTRWTGSLTYRFVLPPGLRDAPCRVAGTLYFADGHGHAYAYRFRLAQYR